MKNWTAILSLIILGVWCCAGAVRADDGECIFGSGDGNTISDHYSLFLVDGSIHPDIDPNLRGDEYWVRVTTAHDKLKGWMQKYDLPEKAPSFTFGMSRKDIGQSWDNFLFPVASSPVDTVNILPRNTSSAYRQSFGIAFIAPYMAIQWLGRCNAPPLVRKLSLLVLTDNYSNKNQEVNISELSDVENELFREGKLAENQYGKVNLWIEEISRFYLVHHKATALFPQDKSGYLEGDKTYLHFFDPTIVKVPMRAHLIEILPREPLVMLNYFLPDHAANLEIAADGYSTKIKFSPADNHKETGHDYLPLRLCAHLVSFSSGEELRELKCVEGDKSINGLVLDVKVSPTEAQKPLALRFSGDFHYLPKGMEKIGLDLGIVQSTSYTMPIALISPLILPDGTSITHEIMVTHPGLSQQEIITIFKSKEEHRNLIILLLTAMVFGGLVWWCYRRYHQWRDRFPTPILASSIIALAESKIDAGLYPHSAGEVILGSERYDLRYIEQIREIVVGYLILKNEASPNKKGLREELDVEMEISVESYPVKNNNELNLSSGSYSESGVLKLNNSQSSSSRFAGCSSWLISMDLKNLRNMERVMFSHHDLLLLSGVVQVSVKGRQDSIQKQRFCIPVEVTKMPYQFSVKIELSEQVAREAGHA